MKPNIFPFIRYTDARAALGWLCRAFGFESQAEHACDGTIVHAELRLGAGVLGLASATPPTPAAPWTAVRQGVYVHVPEVDAHYDRARAAGVLIASPLRDMDYGAREYAARDLDGHLWSFGTYAMGALAGEPNIFPELRYQSADAVEWLARAFGFRTTAQVPGRTGAIVHAEMRLGDGAIMLGIGANDHGMWGDLTQAVSIRVDDPDAYYARCAAAGAIIVQPPTTTHFGARSFWTRDPEGFLWGFSTYRPA